MRRRVVSGREISRVSYAHARTHRNVANRINARTHSRTRTRKHREEGARARERCDVTSIPKISLVGTRFASATLARRGRGRATSRRECHAADRYF